MQSEEQKIVETGDGHEQDSPARSNRTRMLAVRHVAQLLGIHESTVRMWADSNVLEAYRIGPRQDRRIPMESVLRVLEAAKNWPHYGPAKKHEQGTAAP
jgi:excisionase family DNA binding protein